MAEGLAEVVSAHLVEALNVKDDAGVKIARAAPVADLPIGLVVDDGTGTCTLTVVPLIAVTVPKATAKSTGRVGTPVRAADDVARRRAPEPKRRANPAKPEPEDAPRTHPAGPGRLTVTEVALTAPVADLVPVAETQLPVASELEVAATVWVTTVAELRFTVTCPILGFWTSSVSPDTEATVPEVPCGTVGWELPALLTVEAVWRAGVDAAGELDPPHAAAAMATAVSAIAGTTRRDSDHACVPQRRAGRSAGLADTGPWLGRRGEELDISMVSLLVKSSSV